MIQVQPQLTENGLSVYSGALTLQTVVVQNMRIKQAFPNLPNDWYEVFQNRITENGFTDERLIDAVNFVIDNCPYPTPSIAQFIQFDKKIELKTHKQLLELLKEDSKIFSRYDQVKVTSVIYPFYARKEDIQKYKLKHFTKEDQMSLQEKLYKQRQTKKLQDEIERLDTLKYNIKKKELQNRTEEENKFMDGVDEDIKKLERELANLNN